MNKFFYQIFKAPTANVLVQLFRYGFVGGVAFVADYGTLYLATEFVGLHHLLSAAIAFVFGLTVNYLLSTSWVFSEHKTGNRWVEFMVFAFIGVVGLGLNELIIYIGTDLLSFHYMLSKVVSTMLVFFWNFFARKYTLFDKK